MSIEFHCSQCGKLIRAPGTTGGKRGKCPYCKQSVYIPMPPEELEEIPLAPIDEADEARERRLQEEARRLATAINQEEPSKYDTGDVPSTEGSVPLPRDFEVDVPALVNDFLSAMAASDMGRADTAARGLKKHAARARDYAQRLMEGGTPPSELGNIPAPVYKGFLRSLLDLL